MTLLQGIQRFFSLPMKDILLIFFVLELIIGSISMLTFFPIIFNLVIIPKIEKKVGTKLEYRNIVYDIQPFGLLIGKYFEIMFYIVVKHVTLKLGFNPSKIRLGPRFALQLVNYDIRQASYFELFMCYLALFNIVQFFGFGGYTYFTH